MIHSSKTFARSAGMLAISFAFGLLGTPGAGAQDLGVYAGYLPGSIESEAVSPPGLAWETEDGGGPNGSDCILSGLLWTGGDPTIAQLKLTGPGILSFKWNVSSLPNDGSLSCQMSKAGRTAEIGRISGIGGGWIPMEVFVPPGEHVILWIYRKLTYLSGGDDVGRVADVDFTPIAAAPQTFDAYKSTHGVSGSPGATQAGSRRLDTSWLMGLAPEAPAPPALSQVTFANAESRFRMRHSLTAMGLMNPVFSTDLAAWDGNGMRSKLVAGSVTADSLEMEYIMPASQRRFFRCDHAPQVDSPSANLVYIPPGRFLAGSPKSEVGRLWSGYTSGSHGGQEDEQHVVTLTRGFFLCKYETTWAEWVEVDLWASSHGYLITDTGDGARGGRHLLEENGGNTLDSAPAADSSDLHPVTNVNFISAMKWLNAKSEKEGLAPCFYVGSRANPAAGLAVYRNQDVNDLKEIICDWNASGYRVPTEAEWEYSCRAGTVTSLNNGLNLSHGDHYSHWPLLPGEEVEVNDPNLDGIAAYFGNDPHGPTTLPVGSLAPNAFGLYDMHGNVFEWCWDLYDAQVPQQFSGQPLVDPKGASDVLGESRMTRGGSWRTPGHMVRSACRTPAPKPVGVSGRAHDVGFRYCRNAPE